jgi:hypothetical protein
MPNYLPGIPPAVYEVRYRDPNTGDAWLGEIEPEWTVERGYTCHGIVRLHVVGQEGDTWRVATSPGSAPRRKLYEEADARGLQEVR